MKKTGLKFNLTIKELGIENEEFQIHSINDEFSFSINEVTNKFSVVENVVKAHNPIGLVSMAKVDYINSDFTNSLGKEYIYNGIKFSVLGADLHTPFGVLHWYKSPYS